MISFIAFFCVFFFGTILEVFCGVTFYERVRVAVDWLFVGKGHVSFPEEKRHWPFLFLFLCTFLDLSQIFWHLSLSVKVLYPIVLAI